jgi:integrase
VTARCQVLEQLLSRIALPLTGSRDGLRKVGHRRLTSRTELIGRSTNDGRAPWASRFNVATRQIPWNKGRLVGQKAPLRLKDMWAIRVRLQIGHRTRELAVFSLAIDSKLGSCELMRLRVRNVCHGNVVASRTIAMQQKTQRPVQFEITEQTRESLAAWIDSSGISSEDYLFPSRLHSSPHLSTRQYAATR